MSWSHNGVEILNVSFRNDGLIEMLVVEDRKKSEIVTEISTFIIDPEKIDLAYVTEAVEALRELMDEALTKRRVEAP